jgi:N-acetylmuramoyl-L-alanine amidase
MGAGCYVNYANERVLFAMTPNVIMSDGRMYIPASSFAKAVGMKADVVGSELVLSGKLAPILHADKYYRDDEVLWLGRIIHAEAQGEPLLGKIAVGNVVLNRVKSAYYPNTIYGVIFDRKYGVQFSPILNGTIYNTPNFNSTLAAKICLEGFDVSDGAFFFLAPHLATSSWIPKSREYAFTISNHDFYR